VSPMSAMRCSACLQDISLYSTRTTLHVGSKNASRIPRCPLPLPGNNQVSNKLWSTDSLTELHNDIPRLHDSADVVDQ
jgi:hypothetical protein